MTGDPGADTWQRDVRWCVYSAPLMREGAGWPAQAWFDQWQVPHTEVATVTSYRLGVRFEALVAAWIEAEPGLSILACNLAVHAEGRTLGEFDLIVDNRGVIEHWELAIKFYLGTANRRDLRNWYGPNPRDTLARKFLHLRDRQMKLGEQPAARALLKERGWDIQASRALVKGRLFHPWQADRVLPEAVNPDHEQGWWMDAATFARSNAFINCRLVPLDKPRWLSPITAADEQLELLDHPAAITKVSGKQGGTLHLAVIGAEGAELSRGFVVSEAWLAETNR